MPKVDGLATLLFSEKNGLEIELIDESSGVTITAQLSPAETIAALSRMSRVDCHIDFPDDMSLIGKSRESKKETILIDWVEYKPSFEVIEACCRKAGLLIDGWELWQDGTSSQQREVGLHTVVLRRYV